jgi:hypothetical protein
MKKLVKFVMVICIVVYMGTIAGCAAFMEDYEVRPVPTETSP